MCTKRLNKNTGTISSVKKMFLYINLSKPKPNKNPYLQQENVSSIPPETTAQEGIVQTTASKTVMERCKMKVYKEKIINKKEF